MCRNLTLLTAPVTMAVTTSPLGACYATAGAGKDLESAGKGLNNSVNKNIGYKP
jgi:predicted small secreted protein